MTAAIIEKEGKILIARRRKGDSMADKWEFPGGEVEPDETPEECLKRELFEEFGIEAEVGEFIGSTRALRPPQSIELMAYRVSHFSGEFKPSAHEETKWVLPSELNGYDFTEPDRVIIKKLLSRA